MGAIVVDLADAAVEVLNTAGLSPAFTSERSYVPVQELKALVDLKVTVVPRQFDSTMLTRSGRVQEEHVIDVGIQQRVERTPEACDPLMALAEGIRDLFLGRVLAMGNVNATCMAAQNRTLFLPDHLDEKSVFTSVVTLTFKLLR